MLTYLPEAVLNAAFMDYHYDLGEAVGLLYKAGGDAEAVYGLAGRLYVSKSGWLLLEVPNALVRGAFDALHEPGLELPPSGPNNQLTAHISVMTDTELEQVGGMTKIVERGRTFHWQMGPLRKVKPAGYGEMSIVYFFEVTSPELRQLRVSYGLEPFPKGHPFHVTVAVRRKGVLHANDVAKGT